MCNMENRINIIEDNVEQMWEMHDRGKWQLDFENNSNRKNMSTLKNSREYDKRE